MDLFPAIDSHASGMLDVGDGHRVYWEVSGNPRGMPVLFVHGGPGAGTAPVYRRFFDPAFWRIILFDQRGCGRSRPLASVTANTTAHLIADMERLRQALDVDRWLLFGGSWGSTLALAYGQAWPARVLGFVMRGVFLFQPSEVEWFMSGMGNFFPEAQARFLGHLPADERGDPLGAYHRRLTSPDPAIHLPAAHVWCGYEEACARLLPRPDGGGNPDGASLAMARIECHYLNSSGFLAAPLLDGMERIRHLPATIVQGRYDVICPPITAQALAADWPGATLTMIADAGHSAMEPGIRQGLVGAVETMRTRLG